MLSAAVFDGHAGTAAVNFLMENLYYIVETRIDTMSLGLDCTLAERDEALCCPIELHSVLTDCYCQADIKLLEWLEGQPKEDASSGCTATTALVRADRVIVANVGDSRAVLSRKGKALDLSTEHRVYGRGPAVESEISRIESVGGWIDDGRVCGILAVSRAFGDSDFKGKGLHHMLAEGVKEGMWDEEFVSSVSFTGDPVSSEPDVFELTVSQEEDEFLIVATDGLWDVMTSQEVVEYVRNQLRKGNDSSEVAERLASVAVKRRTADNVAVIVIDMMGKEKWESLGVPERNRVFGLF